MKNARLFNNVYSFDVNVSAGNIVNSSTPQYFYNYPFLGDKKVKAVTFTPRLITGIDTLITLVNNAGDFLMYNMPARNLVQTDGGANIDRLYLVDFPNIDLQKSYYTLVTNVGWASSGTIFQLNFYL